MGGDVVLCKGTLMKAQAELPSSRLRYWDWRPCLATRFDAPLFASYFQAQTASRPEPWLHQVRTWSNAEQAGDRPSRVPEPGSVVPAHFSEGDSR